MDDTEIRGSPGKTDEYLNLAEVADALDQLSAGDKLKLHLIEARHLGGSGFTRGQLLQDAVGRALLGDRRCRRNVPFVAFIAQSMRSIASHSRDERRRFVPLDPSPHQSDQLESKRPTEYAAGQLTPEEHLLEKQAKDVLKAILAHFDDDEEAQLVLMGWADGLRGKALRDATGLDQSALDYAIKRIRN